MHVLSEGNRVARLSRRARRSGRLRARLQADLALWLLTLATCSGSVPPGVRAAEPAVADSGARAADAVDFKTEIQPLLSDRCFACHGPDSAAREADLRLDRAGDTAVAVLSPGDPAASEVLRRLRSPDPAERMPPADSGKTPLNEQEIQRLEQWIAAGARYTRHWAFEPIVRPAVPAIDSTRWSRNPIDAFIWKRLQDEQLQPAPPADTRTSVRRLCWDLTGMPPSVEQVREFARQAQQPSEERVQQAWETLVDQLLGSPRHAERMAQYWLDIVRYADTNGIHGDNHRPHSSYRDYVIKAFWTNKPFDQFLTEQLAGDLIDDANYQTRIASGFNRLNMTTREGGAQPKEYEAIYAADRVRNTASIFLGVTLGCAQCHDHKFDPFTTQEFYRFAGFFADVEETSVGVQQPETLPRIAFLRGEAAQQLAQLDAQIRPLRHLLAEHSEELIEAQQQWEISLSGPETAALPEAVRSAIQVARASRSAEQQAVLSDYFAELTPLLAAERTELARLQEQRIDQVGPDQEILITRSIAPRTVRVLPRGNWLDESGEVVQPGWPAAISPETFLPTAGASADPGQRLSRLDLARWLTHPDHPLVARVLVNRLWRIAWGEGLVRTLDDFGSQGARPSHPELLDWLARELIDSGWNMRHVLRLIVTSQAYRQSSQRRAELVQRDPTNRLLARQNRYRVEAEMVRDAALAASGLLVERLGGESVKPYQPAGYWAHLNFPQREYEPDSGENQYRRGLYTYWCRTFLHPSLLAFDAPTREECTVQRPRSNTPLAALVLLNDPSFVEAARALAERMLMADSINSDEGRLQEGFQLVLQREPTEGERAVMLELLAGHRREYSGDIDAARATQAIGQRPPAEGLDPVELAAWTSVARVLLNLHESIMRY